jgi:hypothetical protein
MSYPVRTGPTTKPLAIVIAAQMRIAMPKTAQTHRHVPVNAKHALKHAANSSPAAKAAFKRAAPAVKAATPHLKALAQPGKGMLSSLRHGVSAMHALRQVTHEMGKQKSAAPKSLAGPSAASSVASAFKAAASSSPAAAAAFQRAGPAVANAQHHVEALSRLQETPNRSLLSSLGHGIQAVRALRQVTQGMRGASQFAPIVSAHDGSHTKTSGHTSAHTHERAAPAPANAIDHRALLVQLRQQIASAHSTHADGKHGVSITFGAQAAGIQVSGMRNSAASGPTPFAAMLIKRSNARALASFKAKT